MSKSKFEGRFVVPQASAGNPGFLHNHGGTWYVCSGWDSSYHTEELPPFVQFHPEQGILWPENDGRAPLSLAQTSPEHYLEDLNATVYYAWGDDPGRPCCYDCPAYHDGRDADGDAISQCLLAPTIDWISPGNHNCIISLQQVQALLPGQRQAVEVAERAWYWARWERQVQLEILKMLQERSEAS